VSRGGAGTREGADELEREGADVLGLGVATGVRVAVVPERM
jgi:hypothetical protein